ncbi:hypothetical protein GLAREA_04886 [Glarea lozoyensis ATCC 20868]|uniref:2EXR domain-containing protein n=1 Tax=Glarea lozoyensis (strain ATCC 20868 / MF5171) TaxID=1116229 RepID=S3CQZ3_GLAL2|nr:uncharacterized protein GLAREA_04886 [Glarea lozoyensis ATCC 20868]EPE28095.1 hypothetical protein GLAREA_04886 [Glarea lozoyensis ATCC 20868]
MPSPKTTAPMKAQASINLPHDETDTTSEAQLPTEAENTLVLFSELPYDLTHEGSQATTSHKVSKAATSFTCFGRLAVELRLAIWKNTLEPRNVEPWTKYCYTGYYSTRTPLPSILLVCRESRSFALPFYPLCFGSAWAEPRIRFNMALDTLYVGDSLDIPGFFSTLSPEGLSKIRSFAIDSTTLRIFGPSRYSENSGVLRLLKAMSNLEELIIVYDMEINVCFRGKRCEAVPDLIFRNDVPDGGYRQLKRTMQALYEVENWDWADLKSYKVRRVYGSKECRCKNMDSYRGLNAEETETLPDGESDGLESSAGEDREDVEELASIDTDVAEEVESLASSDTDAIPDVETFPVSDPDDTEDVESLASNDIDDTRSWVTAREDSRLLSDFPEDTKNTETSTSGDTENGGKSTDRCTELESLRQLCLAMCEEYRKR